MKFGELDFERITTADHNGNPTGKISKSMALFNEENEPSGDCVGENKQIRQGLLIQYSIILNKIQTFKKKMKSDFLPHSFLRHLLELSKQKSPYTPLLSIIFYDKILLSYLI